MAVENLITKSTIPYDGRKVVASAGTAEPLVNETLHVIWVTIQALRTNTDYVAIGASTVKVAEGVERGEILSAESAAPIENVDLNTIYVNSIIDGEGVSFLYRV